LVCFAGLGPGEVHRGGRKVVGLAQWRGREGALFSAAAYRRFDPGPLLDALDLGPDDHQLVRDIVSERAVGLEALLGGRLPAGTVGDALLSRLPPGDWELVKP
jgi:lipoate---protein ligase